LNYKISDPLIYNMLLKNNLFFTTYELPLLNVNDDVYVQDFLDKTTVGVTKLSN